MPIDFSEEVWEGRDASFGDDGRRTYTLVYRVGTRFTSDGQIAVAFGPHVPPMWSAYRSFLSGEVDPLALLRKKDPRQDPGNPLLWLVTLTYDTDGIEPAVYDAAGNPTSADEPGRPGGGSGSMDNPEMLPWEVSVTTQDVTKPFALAIDPKDVTRPWQQRVPRTVPVLNTAGDRYDPYPPLEDGYDVLTVVRHELTHDRKRYAAYRYALNSDTFCGAGPGEAQFLPVHVDLVTRGRIRCWKKAYRVRFFEPELLPDGTTNATWQPALLSQGFRKAMLDVDGNVVPRQTPSAVLDGHQQPVTTPVFLDARGQPIAPDDLRTVGKGSKVVVQRFNARRMLPFAPWNLEVPI